MEPKRLNRFTNLPSLLDILARKKLTLLNPETWDDKNDSYVINQYKARKKLKTVLALCFASQSERYHHWKVFADGSSGVCIEFVRIRFMASFEKCCKTVPEFRSGEVDYLTLDGLGKLDDSERNVNRWPFLKRKAFIDEREFRIIFESKDDDKTPKEIPIEIGCIRKITLSPWLHRSLFKTVAETIKQVEGCDKLVVKHSSLLTTLRWREKFR